MPGNAADCVKEMKKEILKEWEFLISMSENFHPEILFRTWAGIRFQDRHRHCFPELKRVVTFISFTAIIVSFQTLQLLFCDYILPFSASLQKDNFYAVQFHPEKIRNRGKSDR